MIVAVLAFLAWQRPQPASVGDTVWVTTTARAPARMIVRPQTWDLGDLGQVLGPPDVSYRADSVTIRYPVAIWYPGEHDLRVPGPILVSPEGASDTLPAASRTVLIASVLPPDSARSRLQPKPAADTVPQARLSLLPVAILLLLAGVGVGLIALLRRARLRRRQSLPEPVPEPLPATEYLTRWAKAGELRAALDGWSRLIERAAARVKDETTRERVDAWVDAADRAGFTDHPSPAELERLIADAAPLLALAERRSES